MTTSFHVTKDLTPVEPQEWLRERIPGYSSFRKWTTAEAFESFLGKHKRDPYDAPNRRKPWIETPVLEGYSNRTLHACTGQHGFLQAAHHAYDCHLPLTFSPDHVWMLVIQALAKTLKASGERFRSAFVDHEGQQYIEIQRNSFIKGNPGNDWEGCFAEFSEKMEAYIKPEMYQTLRAEYSTTQDLERATADVAFMDAMKEYFKYGMRTCCGIPRVNLEGERHEWTDIYDRFLKLDELINEAAKADAAKHDSPLSPGLKWAQGMKAALEAFKDAADGYASKTTWENFFKLRSVGSGGPDVTGWIRNFFPHVTGQHPNDFNAGFSTVPVKWMYYEQDFDMRFVSGFVGVNLNLDDGKAVRPEMGWCIYEEGNIEKRDAEDGGAFGSKEGAEYVRIDD